MPDNNINMGDILRSQGIKGEFDKKAKVSIDEAQEGAWDKSIFDNKDSFVEHYTNEIFGEGNDSMAIGDFMQKAVDNGFIDEDSSAAMQDLIDRNNDGTLSKDELTELIGTAYDSAESMKMVENPPGMEHADTDTDVDTDIDTDIDTDVDADMDTNMDIDIDEPDMPDINNISEKPAASEPKPIDSDKPAVDSTNRKDTPPEPEATPEVPEPDAPSVSTKPQEEEKGFFEKIFSGLFGKDE